MRNDADGNDRGVFIDLENVSAWGGFQDCRARTSLFSGGNKLRVSTRLR